MLTASLSATPHDDEVALTLTVSNDGDEPVTLRFRTGQRADFAAYAVEKTGEADASGPPDPVWQHGAGRMFTQVLGSETLAADESVTYEAAWSDPCAGIYRIVGMLTAEDSDVEAVANIDID